MGKKLHIKKDDIVYVLSGKDRGKEGRVLRVIPAEDRAIVEGVNVVSKHVRPSQQYPDGGIIQQEAPIHVSNLMLVDPSTKERTRIGRKRNEDGKGWVRYSKKSGEIIK
ncbi:50S ribosomal protein L24 [Pontibacter sp. G13]|uniref:50S ribosomal protein L24 n=1 Tax=Pontibacter sp. G13 TaxID=3074898 RepID=UPI002889FAD2|nr:50S ribosomal protein L24 [Pontibacter sp. G13]WNJ16528.1 50S ribosomal protein L24 [Pontibacter sp. G13]